MQIKTIKDEWGMALDEIISYELEEAPKNARFNKSNRWSRKKFDLFLTSINNILNDKGSEGDFERIEKLF